MSNESSERRVRETDSADKCGRSAVNYSTAQPTKLYVGCSGSVFSALAHQLIKYTQRYQPAYPKDAVDLSKWRLIYLFNEKCTTRNAAASMLYSVVCGSHFAFLIWHFSFRFCPLHLWVICSLNWDAVSYWIIRSVADSVSYRYEYTFVHISSYRKLWHQV